MGGKIHVDRVARMRRAAVDEQVAETGHEPADRKPFLDFGLGEKSAEYQENRERPAVSA